MSKIIGQAKNGFTIIELLIVVSVVGVLGAIGFNSYRQLQAEARDTNRLVKVSSLGLALEKYYNNHGDYPTCESLSSNVNNVAQNILPGLDKSLLQAPQGAENSIICGTITNNTNGDVFAYSRTTSTCGSLPPATCSSFTLQYKNEASDQIGQVSSKH